MDSCKITLKILSTVEKLCSVLEEQDDEYFIITVTHQTKFLHTGSAKGRRFLESNPDLTHLIGQMFMTHCYGNKDNKKERPAGHSVTSTSVMQHSPQLDCFTGTSSVQASDNTCRAAEKSDLKQTTNDKTLKSDVTFGSNIVSELNKNENVDKMSGIGEKTALMSTKSIKQEVLDSEFVTESEPIYHCDKSQATKVDNLASPSSTAFMISSTSECSKTLPRTNYQCNENNSMFTISDNRDRPPAILTVPSTFARTSLEKEAETDQKQNKQSHYRSLITGNVVKVGKQNHRQSVISSEKSFEISHVTRSSSVVDSQKAELQDLGSTTVDALQDHGESSYEFTIKQKTRRRCRNKKQHTRNSHEEKKAESDFISDDREKLAKKGLNMDIQECNTSHENFDGKLPTNQPSVEMNKSVTEGKYDGFFSDLSKSLKTEPELQNNDYVVYNDFDNAGLYGGFTVTCNEEAALDNEEKMDEQCRTLSLKSDVKMEPAWESEYLLTENDSGLSHTNIKSVRRNKGEGENVMTKSLGEKSYNDKKTCRKSCEINYAEMSRRSSRNVNKAKSSENAERDEPQAWCSSDITEMAPSRCAVRHQELSSESFGIELNMGVSRDEDNMYLHYSYDKSENFPTTIDEENYDDKPDEVLEKQRVSLYKQFGTARNKKKKKILGSSSKTEYLHNSSKRSPPKRKRRLNRKEEDSDEDDTFLQYIQNDNHTETSLSSAETVGCENFQSKSENKEKCFSSSKKSTGLMKNTQTKSTDRLISDFFKEPDLSSALKNKICKVDEETVKDPSPCTPKIVAYRSLLTGRLMAVDTYSVSKKNKA